VPQSYTPESPAIMRAKMLDYDPYKQVRARLKAFNAMGHPTDKIELIIMGGTFPAYPVKYQYEFVKRCYDALNDSRSKDLGEAKRKNESAKHKCVALCIETRPDVCGSEEINRMLEFGATRCEIGVQIPDDAIYKKVKRGHTVKDVIDATKRLKDAGFKVGYHLMPGLPGSNLKKDILMFQKLFSNVNFKPDQIKIYPTQVIKGSELEKIWKKGKYEPYTQEELMELLIKLKSKVPEYCRIMRIMREIPPSYMAAGTRRIDLRNEVKKKMQEMGIKCRCIRCREVGYALRRGEIVGNKLKLKKIEYAANGGKEIFLSFVDSNDVIFALCRLRIPGKKREMLVRELHVYGPEVEVGSEAEGKVQHTGFGKKLMREAESIARKKGCEEIKVISGVGVREYYRKLGYVLDGEYMTKRI
jgi:elongator complex protein 3